MTRKGEAVRQSFGLLVSDRGQEKAQVVQWTFWVMTKLEKPLLSYLVHFGRWRYLDEATLAQARAGFDRPFRVLEEHLSTQPWLLDDHFTAADLNVAGVMDWARVGQVDLSVYPGIADWLTRCLCRPAFEGLAFRWPAAVVPAVKPQSAAEAVPAHARFAACVQRSYCRGDPAVARTGRLRRATGLNLSSKIDSRSSAPVHARVSAVTPWSSAATCLMIARSHARSGA